MATEDWVVEYDIKDNDEAVIGELLAHPGMEVIRRFSEKKITELAMQLTEDGPSNVPILKKIQALRTVVPTIVGIQRDIKDESEARKKLQNQEFAAEQARMSRDIKKRVNTL